MCIRKAENMRVFCIIRSWNMRVRQSTHNSSNHRTISFNFHDEAINRVVLFQVIFKINCLLIISSFCWENQFRLILLKRCCHKCTISQNQGPPFSKFNSLCYVQPFFNLIYSKKSVARFRLFFFVFESINEYFLWKKWEILNFKLFAH